MESIDFNKLWRNFVDTITNHYADFDGRVGLSQFWYYVLVNVVVGIVVAIVGGVIGLAGPLRALYSLALFLPSLGMTARRLHDTGRPGTWAWLLAVPFGVMVLMGVFAVITLLTLGLGAVLFILSPILGLASLAAIAYLIYLCVQAGEAGPNAYGPVPQPWTAKKETAPIPPVS